MRELLQDRKLKNQASITLVVKVANPSWIVYRYTDNAEARCGQLFMECNLTLCMSEIIGQGEQVYNVRMTGQTDSHSILVLGVTKWTERQSKSRVACIILKISYAFQPWLPAWGVCISLGQYLGLFFVLCFPPTSNKEEADILVYHKPTVQGLYCESSSG